MRVYLDQIGCRLNYSEMESLAGALRAAGHLTVSSAEHAQVVVFNTCAVTREAGRKSRQRIRQLHRENPDARIAVTGCWSTLSRAKAEALPGVAMVADNEEKELLPSLLEPWSSELDDPATLARMQPDGTPFDGEVFDTPRRSRTRAFIKVQDGCNNRCTFCIVTLARGKSRSRSLSDVVADVQSHVAQGAKEAVLTGVHLGSYGRDLAIDERANLKRLVDAILRETDIARLRLSSLEPWELADGFFDLWQQWPGRLCPHLHLPLQAGTDKQLRAMARRCTVESYRRLVEDARAEIPDLVVTTDLIVGFPGETESDFDAGLSFVEEMRFAHAHVFPFSARPGTTAASYGDTVPKDVKKERSRRMHEVVAQTGHRERLRFVGTERPVLWEGEGRPLEDSDRLLWTGLTDNYLRVAVEAAEQDALSNTVTSVSLVALHDDVFLGSVRYHEDRNSKATGVNRKEWVYG
jgi:threonylcarbamoyladenosine tRNA methylthiotransferase MtaB